MSMKKTLSAFAAALLTGALLLSGCSFGRSPQGTGSSFPAVSSEPMSSLTSSPELVSALESSAASASSLFPASSKTSTSSAGKTSSKQAVSSKKNPPASSSKAAKPSSSKAAVASKKPDTGKASSSPAADSSTFVQEVFKLVNQERAKEGLPALKLDATLCQAAQKRAKEIKTKFDHTRPDGTGCFTVFKEFGISYMAAGENIAAGQTTPKQVMNGWMNSKGHRANIMSGDFNSIGIGFDNNHWVQLFIG